MIQSKSYMEPRLDSGTESNAHKTERYSPTKPRNKLGSVLKIEKHERSYDDFHPQILKNIDGKLPKSKGFYPKQIGKNPQKCEDLVMCMSNLPNYLEREENSQEKTLNIGVLDWRLLKKWQHNQKDLCHINSNNSHFSGNISAVMSSEASTSHSSLSCSFTPSQQRSELKAPSTERCCDGDKFFSGNEKSLQDCKSSPINGVKELKNKDLQRQHEPKSILSEKSSVVSVLKGNDIIHWSIKKNQEKKKAGPVRISTAEDECRQMETETFQCAKHRNSSPTGKLKFGMAKITKSSSSNATSACVCPIDCTCDASNATSRSRTSPLRRLLDPFFKPKGGGNSCHLARSKDLSRIDRSCKFSGEISGYPASTLVNGISNVTDNKKNEPSTLQALLQVAIKNGVPLYTFTVDNRSEILASTVKESCSPKRKERRWIFTFFSFSETKKKNGSWIYQGSNNRNNEYIPNIVARMKASDVAYPNSQKSMIKSSVREFVLSSAGSRDVDRRSDSMPHDELAAIVINFHEKISGLIHEDNQVDQPAGLKEPFRKVINCSYNGDGAPNGTTSDDSFNASVILPVGDHGLPSKGEPSPLIKRWKSGGSCDCGGWDLGCRLRILSSGGQISKWFAPTSGQFKLFFEEESGEKRPFYVLSPFKDGIFSVEFNSSIKLIQAFSIGIAVLNSGKTPGEITEKSEPKTSNQAVSEVSEKYVSYPPVSPFGRV
ncbi:uncharacterized protein LOC142541129 isoform X1 [Primulina tabacum]|uniref:uncharacterized protein LOC142541129 isoform X1 n=2 Tax=Primulina tabacum TaxID=48773 RepID=UPI003F5AD3EE